VIETMKKDTPTMIQPAITGYRQLTNKEAALMNKIKALGIELGALVAELRAFPPTPPGMPPFVSEDGRPSLDQRWVSIGATDLQTGLMALTRGVAQPTTF
jgi:hypothetical protein